MTPARTMKVRSFGIVSRGSKRSRRPFAQEHSERVQHAKGRALPLDCKLAQVKSIALQRSALDPECEAADRGQDPCAGEQRPKRETLWS